MQTKVLVSLAGGLAEDDGNVVLVSQGQALPTLALTNTYIRNDELCFQQGYEGLSKPIVAKGGAIVLSSLSAFLIGTTLLAQGGTLNVSSLPSSLSLITLYAQGGELFLSSSSASLNVPAVIQARGGSIKLSSLSAGVAIFTSLQPAYNLTWILTAGE
jgi:hypothetical protein